MASSKDIYEADIYAAGMYAAGIWRGIGVDDLWTDPTCTITTNVTMASNSISSDVTISSNSITTNVGMGCGNQG